MRNFRRDNREAIRVVYRATLRTAPRFKLIGARMVATDSTRLRAQNSRKNNFSKGKIRRQLDRIEQAEAAHGKIISGEGRGDFAQAVLARRALKRQKRRYRQLQARLAASGQRQLSTSDPDSRLMITRHNQIEVAYNVQATVDGDNKLIVDYLVTNEKDDRALGLMVERAGEALQTRDMTMLFDKGYHSGAELQKAEALGVEVLVAIPDPASQAPDPAYNLEAFRYNPRKHSYTCPQGRELKTNGRWYQKHSGQQIIQVQHFKTAHCATCPVRDACTHNPKGRLIERSQYAEVVEANKRRMSQRGEDYRLRSQLVEHPFGTLKRQWGFDHIVTKRFMNRASADLGLMLSAFNLRRLFNLVGKYLPRGLEGGPETRLESLLRQWIGTMAATRRITHEIDSLHNLDYRIPHVA
jgi:hypothetical protein